MPALTASPAMRQALQKAVPASQHPAPRHAVHKSAASGFAPSNEVAKNDMAEPADPVVLSARRARTARRNALHMRLRRLARVLFAGLPTPMTTGIYEEIVARLELNVAEQADLRFVLYQHVNGYLYQKALRDGAVRLDLDSMPAGEVTAEQRDCAVEMIAKIKAEHVHQARNGKR